MGERTCSRGDCDRPHYGLDYCRVHYRRLKKSGTTDLPPRQDKGCKVDGCPDRHYSLGWCNLHYNRQFRTGSVETGVDVVTTYVCTRCGESFDRDPDRLTGKVPDYCSGCRPFVQAETKQRWYQKNAPELVTEYTCRFCGCLFCYVVPDGKTRSVCSACLPKTHVERHNRWKNRYPDKVARVRMRAHARRRARRFHQGAQMVDRQTVCNLHGWICHLCQKSIDPLVRYPDRSSASLDHVIPLSRGGKHTYANCRPAHWICNVRKGNKVSAGKPAA